MTVCRRLCPSCGPVWIAAWEMSVVVCADDLATSTVFACPWCGVRVSNEVDARLAHRLADAGAAVSVWDLPAELAEPHPAGPPFSEDDVERLRRCLDRDSWCEAMCGLCREERRR